MEQEFFTARCKITSTLFDLVVDPLALLDEKLIRIMRLVFPHTA
jgi:hypothetical protein